MTDFDRDPAALAWARAQVQEFINRLADFEAQAKAKGDPATATGCAVSRLLAQRHFLGDGGCVIGVFDQRRPDLEWLHNQQPAAHDSRPSVAEATADDRRWPLQKAGE